MQTLILILILLVAFQFKHFIADFIIQRLRQDGMAKFQKTGWAFPLFKHCLDHAILTVLISFITLSFYDVENTLLWVSILFIFDMVIHFSMDRIKASPNVLGRFKIEDWGFWLSIGVDQMVHHLTHYAIVATLVMLSLIL